MDSIAPDGSTVLASPFSTASGSNTDTCAVGTEHGSTGTFDRLCPGLREVRLRSVAAATGGRRGEKRPARRDGRRELDACAVGQFSQTGLMEWTPARC